MIYIFGDPNCKTCPKAIKYFEKNNVPFKRINILSQLKFAHVREMFDLIEGDTNELIAFNSKEYMNSNINIDEMHIHDLIEYILLHPKILKRPIIYNQHIIQVGYNEEEITAFLPVEMKHKDFYKSFEQE